LHVAVGLYHFDNQNFKGAVSQLNKAQERLKKFLPQSRGVHIEQLLNNADPFRLSAVQRVESGTTTIKIQAFPSIVWDDEEF